MFLTASSAHIQLLDVRSTEGNENANQPLSQVNRTYENEDVTQPTRNELIPSMYLTVPGNESHYEQIPCMDYLTPAPNVQQQDQNKTTELVTDYLTPVSAELNQNTVDRTAPTADNWTPIANNKSAKESIELTTDDMHMAPVATSNNKYDKESTEPTTDCLAIAPPLTESNNHGTESFESTTGDLNMTPIATANNKHANKGTELITGYLTPVATTKPNQNAADTTELTADYPTPLVTAAEIKTELSATDYLTPIANMRDQNKNETTEKAPRTRENDVKKQSHGTASQLYEYDDVEAPNKNEQINSQYLSAQESERPYDLPLTGYMNPGTGVYTGLTRSPHTYEDQQ